jgi:hypothetical protein
MKSCKQIVEQYANELYSKGVENFVHYNDIIVTIDILSGSLYKLGNYHVVVDYVNDTVYLTNYRLKREELV